MTHRVLRCLLPMALGLAVTAAGAAESIAVEHGWARATPPGAANGALFMTLVNRGGKDNALVRAESDAAQAVELHTHVMDQGVARMRQVPDIPVAAGGRTELRPGGLHIMLIGLKAPLAEGGKVAVTLRFRDGAAQQLTLPVRRGEHAGH